MTQKNIRLCVITLLIVLFGVAFIDSSARADNAASVSYQTVTIDGVDIFYREHDEIFSAVGAEPYKRDLENLEYHLLDTGHFALETHGQEIADLIRNFLNRNIETPMAAN